MGWQNPPTPWREFERTLSGRPRRLGRLADPDADVDVDVDADITGDGGDAPGWSRKRAPYAPPRPRPSRVSGPHVPYTELHAHSSFSFLDGASTPEELAEEAERLGLEAIALTDHDGMYGVVRFGQAADSLHLPTIFGAELSLDLPRPSTQVERMIGSRAGVPDPPGRHLLALARGPAGYAQLSRAISTAQLRGGAKGRPVYDLDELSEAAAGQWLILTGCRKGPVRHALETGGFGTFALDPARRALAELVDRFGRDNVVVELDYALDPLADERYDALARLADEARLPVIASTAAHYHGEPRRPLATAMAAVRARSSLDELDGWLPGWTDQHLRSGEEMSQRFARWPGVVENTVRLGRELAFKLKLVAPELPPFPLQPGHPDEMSYLRQLTLEGARLRFTGKPHEARAYQQLEHELKIIEQLNFPGYFLVVWDIARFCRENGILCQGRGSAANSAVCYALQVTAVDAVFHELLFERFLAPHRKEKPDIDIDIQADRREEVIQYVYRTHGREHTAQVANVITYRPKSAIRDVAKALGYSPGQQDAWSKHIEQGHYWSPRTVSEISTPEDTTTGNIAAEEPPPQRVVELAEELQNAPRHLGIHSGGMVICDRPIVEVCPVEWGRMPNRTVLQWDKDDCEGIGLVKFDLLGLGMLSALQKCFDLVEQWHGVRYDLDSIPKEQKCVYDMLEKADSIGVFQVESRAQMATLPRLKPKSLYDLAIEVALIRPGPIQGNAVHPYIRRRDGLEADDPPHPLLKSVLERTKGVPLFQEQLMQMAMEIADFTPAESDLLRRAMGSKRSREHIGELQDRLYEGMARHGITGELAESIYDKINAFASFGFAESHAISFALLVYASSWLKLHYPAAFTAALLNSQPMGFYSPQSLVHDAKRHGIEVRKPEIDISGAGARLETGTGPLQCVACDSPPQPAVRMGLSSVRTIGTELAERIAADRESGGAFTSMTDLAHRIGLSADQIEALATAGAFDCFDLTRRDALWRAGAVASSGPDQLDVVAFDETSTPDLPAMTAPEQLIADMWATRVTPDVYPTALIRERLDALGIIPAIGLQGLDDRIRVTVGGVVTHRQRPATAGGVTFLNLEDETGMVNVICNETVWSRHRRVARESGGLVIRGMLERTGPVINILAERIDKLPLGLRTSSRDFR